MMNITITLTDAARDYLKSMMEKEKGKAFRLTIKKTGCSGFSYLPSIVKDGEIGDSKLEVNGIKVFVDSEWNDLLDGLHIDYIQEEKMGLKQKRLIFTNPKEASRCGCGESFHVGGSK